MMKYSRESPDIIVSVSPLISKKDPKQNSVPAVTSEIGGNQILLCVSHNTLERPLRRGPVKPKQLCQ